jgi:hypothetical protein
VWVVSRVLGAATKMGNTALTSGAAVRGTTAGSAWLNPSNKPMRQDRTVQ